MNQTVNTQGAMSGASAARPVWLTIALRELAAFFTSPVAYIVGGLFLIFSGFLLFSSFFLVNRAELRQFFTLLPMLWAFFIPALTMRLFADEKRSGTIEILFTLPVAPWHAVLGKYLATLVYAIAMLLPTLVYAFSVAAMRNLDWGPVIGGYLGAIFLASSFAAIGVFASSLTKNQIVAFFIAFGLGIVLVVIHQLLVLLPAWAVPFLQFVSAGYHFDSIARGILDSRDIIYFISTTALFLVLGVRSLSTRRIA